MKRIIAFVLIFVLLFAGCSAEGKPEENGSPTEETASVSEEELFPKLIIESVEEQEDFVLMKTSYGVLKYPFAFSDILKCYPMTYEDSAKMEFCAEINGDEYTVFCIVFGESEGIFLGTAEIGEAKTDVYAEFYSPQGIEDDGVLKTFYAAQECFNDISVSLFENPGFVFEA